MRPAFFHHMVGIVAELGLAQALDAHVILPVEEFDLGVLFPDVPGEGPVDDRVGPGIVQVRLFEVDVHRLLVEPRGHRHGHHLTAHIEDQALHAQFLPVGEGPVQGHQLHAGVLLGGPALVPAVSQGLGVREGLVGQATSLGEGEEFVEKLMQYNQDSVVIIDEAYVDFGGFSSVALTKKYENLLVTGTFSKSRSLAGLRIGFAIGSKKLISVLEAVKNSYNSYTVDSLSIEMGVASIEDDEYFKSTVSKIIATRTNTTNQLKAMGFDVLDSSTNFIMATHNDLNMKDMFEYLKSQKVFIRYFNLPRIDNYVRITVGTDDEMAVLIAKIKEYKEIMEKTNG